LIDTDPYIPDTNGTQWYINQNQFYRQIRNFIIDLTGMPPSNVQDGQTYVPTGIHWQVAQATSLQNIDFVMRISDPSDDTTAVGIFMENVSLQDVILWQHPVNFKDRAVEALLVTSHLLVATLAFELEPSNLPLGI
jgi:hypothetical protein